MDARLQREISFHDQRFGNDDQCRQAAEKFYSIIGPARKSYRSRVFQDCRGRDILEYGCGTGSDAFELAANGANVTGIDISIEALQLARGVAEERDLGIDFLQMNAEELEFDDRSFDLICGTGILHHLDLEKSLSEIARVLRPGGRAVFTEPLGHNPLINLYRRLTPTMRTVDEHPLFMHDLRNAKRHFERIDAKHFGLMTLGTVPFRNRSFFRSLLATVDSLEQGVMNTVPVLKRYSWMVVLEFSQPLSAGGSEAIRESTRHGAKSS